MLDLFGFGNKMIGDAVVVVRNADGTPTNLTITPAGIARGNLPAILPSSLLPSSLAEVGPSRGRQSWGMGKAGQRARCKD